MSSGTLYDAVREAVTHRDDWPLPIYVVPAAPRAPRSMTPGCFRALAGDAPEELARRAVIRLSGDDLRALAPCADDFQALDAVVERIISNASRVRSHRR